MHKHNKVWNNIKHFATTIGNNEEWLTIGDFNQVIATNEKISLKNTTIQGEEQLIECLNTCKLCEIPPKGQFMTWTNNRE